jgi:hypothetical protein
MQAVLQVCGQISGACGIVLSALSSRISQQETLLPGVMSDVGLAGVLVTLLSIAFVGSIAATEARREQALRRLRESELMTALAELRHRLDEALPHAGKDFAGGGNQAQIQDQIALANEELERVRGGGGFAAVFARKFVNVNL